MGHPGAVEAVAGLALLVLADLLARASSVTSGSRRLGMNALMPPMAWAPRRWQARTRACV